MKSSNVLRPNRLLALAAAFACAGCATTVNVAGRFPARNQAAADLRRVAIAGFRGGGGNEFAAALETELASAQFDGKPYFTLLGGGASNGVDAISAREYGRSVGAAGVYFGLIREQAKGEPQQMERTQCARWDNLVCKQWYKVPVTCELRTVTVTVTPRLLNVATGEIVYTANKAGQEQTTWCPGVARKSEGTMIAEIQRGILRDIRMDVAPNVQIVHAEVMDDASNLNDTMSASFEEAVKQMKAGDAQQACTAWSKIRGADSSHMPTIFNLGVCAETAGHYKEALDLYNQAGDLLAHSGASAEGTKGIGDWLRTATANAQALVDRPEDKIATAKIRVQRLIAAQGQLTTIEKERQAEAARKLREAAAIEQRREEEADRERRQAAAAIRHQKEMAAAHKRDLIAHYGKSAADAILKKEVTTGMDKDAVLASIGKPQHKEAASASEEMWSYPSEEVIFTNGKVSYVEKGK
ncbi:MAG TPA: hypothetical protein VMV91_01625 [Rhodocyclaceae bacterium]|nr:hypothetical protein [Rhodocyclaceae bacterium]